eukprot:CAMPEP_0183342592 /NCGR_PEP_ID=MMETSP0164_2-20130417/8681_1 /TAXON_ID=221442 /ORGANISM="Coccolithus pelagicus ssp braarudi, Strain PLY182g" /LENGTH=339 /DNA_ID=CAMNT_0025513231 /DNA_START=34 /DNA_END=1053 /DNA_ORIENTATION=-
MVVLVSCYSADGEFLLCATTSGWVHVWRTQSSREDDALPAAAHVSSVRLHTCAIYSISLVDAQGVPLLISSTDSDVCGWKWEAVLADQSAPVPLFQFQNTRSDCGPPAEVNALAFDVSSARLYAGSGDGNAYGWDLATQRCVSTFAGHKDMVHCLALRQRHQQLITGSEDGTMRLWDVRSQSCAHVLQPHLPPLTEARASTNGNPSSTPAGLWCSCMALDADEIWLAAGWGAGYLTTIELNALACVACLPTAAPPQAVGFLGTDGHLVSVGAEQGVYHWNVTGELLTRATCCSPSAFALATHSSNGQEMVAVGGSSPFIDIFSDMSHKLMSVAVPSEQV